MNHDLEFGNHRITVTCTEAVLLSLDGQPFKALSPGTNRVDLRQTSGQLEADSTGKAKVHLQVTSRATPQGEKLDDLPPPAPPTPDNFLQMMRLKVRQQMGVTREAFTEFTTPYEDAPPVFEEDLPEYLKQQRTNEDVRQEDEARPGELDPKSDKPSQEPDVTEEKAEK